MAAPIALLFLAIAASAWPTVCMLEVARGVRELLSCVFILNLFPHLEDKLDAPIGERGA
jgi:hypothetical protein